jgi:hypothetical protein
MAFNVPGNALAAVDAASARAGYYRPLPHRLDGVDHARTVTALAAAALLYMCAHADAGRGRLSCDLSASCRVGNMGGKCRHQRALRGDGARNHLPRATPTACGW